MRDNIHATDVSRFIAEFIRAPICGEVYNIGGGKANGCSILEAFGRNYSGGYRKIEEELSRCFAHGLPRSSKAGQ